MEYEAKIKADTASASAGVACRTSSAAVLMIEPVEDTGSARVAGDGLSAIGSLNLGQRRQKLVTTDMPIPGN